MNEPVIIWEDSIKNPANQLHEKDGKVYDGYGIELPDLIAWGSRTLFDNYGNPSLENKSLEEK